MLRYPCTLNEEGDEPASKSPGQPRLRQPSDLAAGASSVPGYLLSVGWTAGV